MKLFRSFALVIVLASVPLAVVACGGATKPRAPGHPTSDSAPPEGPAETSRGDGGDTFPSCELSGPFPPPTRDVVAIPPVVATYLASEDGLFRVTWSSQHPELRELLADPETRRMVMRFLASEEAHAKGAQDRLPGLLGFVSTGATPTDLPWIGPYRTHPHARVRLRAYDVYVHAFFKPPDARRCLLETLKAMLDDDDDVVRESGAFAIQSARAAGELGAFLSEWLTRAPPGTSSRERVERMLAAPVQGN